MYGGIGRATILFALAAILGPGFWARDSQAAAAAAAVDFEHITWEAGLAGFEVGNAFAGWPPAFEDVAGDGTLEAVQFVQSDTAGAFQVWSIDAANKSFVKLGAARLPDPPALERPLLLHWAQPAPGAKEVLFAAGPNGAWMLEPDFKAGTYKTTKIVDAKTRMTNETSQPLRLTPFAFDIDRDGAAEIYLYSEIGHELWSRGENGRYTKRALPKGPTREMAHDVGPFQFGTYLTKPVTAFSGRQPRQLSYSAFETTASDSIQFQDANGDGRIDCVWPNAPFGPGNADTGSATKIAAWVAYQNVGGDFGPIAPLLNPDYEWLPENTKVGPLNFDGDGQPDFLAMHSTFSLDDPRTTLGIYYGKWGPKPESGPGKRSMISTRDPTGLIWPGDLDGDGIDDLCITYFSYLISSAGDMIDYFLQDDAKFTLRFFYGKKGEGISERETNDSIEVKAKTSTFGWPLAPPFDLSGDFNADGYKDLLLRRSEKEISLRLQQPGKQKFSPRELRTFAIPDSVPVAILDLNADAADDIVSAGSQPGTLRLHLSKRK